MQKQETEQEEKNNTMTVIFGQMSLEKPNVGKPVQQIQGFYYYAVVIS